MMSAFRFRNIYTSAMALFVALWLTGGQSMVMQVTAWSGMLVSRSFESSLKEAVVTTFDGQHPCAMCTAIKHVQKDREDPQAPAPLKILGKLKIDASIDVHTIVVAPSSLLLVIPWPDMILASSTCDLDPPVPPPRLAA